MTMKTLIASKTLHLPDCDAAGWRGGQLSIRIVSKIIEALSVVGRRLHSAHPEGCQAKTARSEK